MCILHLKATDRWNMYVVCGFLVCIHDIKILNNEQNENNCSAVQLWNEQLITANFMLPLQLQRRDFECIIIVAAAAKTKSISLSPTIAFMS